MANVILSIEIEIPDDLSDELADAVTDDLTCDNCLDELRRRIKAWARTVTGEICHVSVEAE